jgi:hypothetical protein
MAAAFGSESASFCSSGLAFTRLVSQEAFINFINHINF